AVATAHDLQPHLVGLLPPRTVLKTSSGKVQRRACRQAFLSSRLGVSHLDAVAATVGPCASRGDGRRETHTPTQPGTPLLQLVRSEVARLSGVRAEDVDASCSPKDLGMDSLMGLELRYGLARATGLSVDDTLFSRDLPLVDIAGRLEIALME